jgi:hypothetical protein
MKLKEATLGQEIVTPATLATPSSVGLVKVGNGLCVGSDGSLYLKCFQGGKFYMPSGEMTDEETPRPIFRTFGLVTVQGSSGSRVTAEISTETFVWDESTQTYKPYP